MPNTIRNNFRQTIRKPPHLQPHDPFPPVEQALGRLSHCPGLLATGGVLDVPTLEAAYRQGIFPWPNHMTQKIMWFSTHPRMVLRPADFRLYPSLRKTIRRFRDNPACSIRVDSAFEAVIRHCAHTPRDGQPGSWITDDIISAYCGLHQIGLAHSVEAWVDGQLVGGLYCVAIGRSVCGESMFAHQRDASKIALAALVALCRMHDVPYIDCQQETPHLASLGAQPIDRADLIASIQHTQHLPAMQWQFDPALWQHILPPTHTAGAGRPAHTDMAHSARGSGDSADSASSDN